MKIEKPEKKLALQLTGALLVILVFWFFVYAPKSRYMKKLRNELENVQMDIDKVKKMAGDNESLDVLIEKYNERLKELEVKIPSKEEAVLRELAFKANEMGIEVLSISPSVSTESNLPIKVDEYKCKELPVNIQLRAPYVKLGEYILALRDKLSALVTLEEINIEKEKEEGAKSVLNASIKVTLYTLVPKNTE